MHLLDNGVWFGGELHCQLILGAKYIPMGFVEKCDFAQLFLAVGGHSQIHFIGTSLLPLNCIIVSLTPSSDRRHMLNKAVYIRLNESCRYFVEFISLCRYRPFFVWGLLSVNHGAFIKHH